MFGHIHDNADIVISNIDKKFLSNSGTFTDNIDEVVVWILSYESSTSSLVYFSLKVKDSFNYLNIDKANNIIISPIKRIFWLSTSSIDNFPRSKILASVEYTVATTVENLNYSIMEVIFLSTTWYEKIKNTCVLRSGISNLLTDTKGYTTKQWCNLVSNISYCKQGELCNSKCIGKCADPTLICYVNNYTFTCGNPILEPSLDGTTIIPPRVTGIGATVIAVILIIIIIALIIWTFVRRS